MQMQHRQNKEELRIVIIVLKEKQSNKLHQKSRPTEFARQPKLPAKVIK